MGKIKKVYKEDFTVVSTQMYRDKRLTLKDRGLLGTMLSLPENWDFSIKGLAAILDDGEKAVRNSLQHLEEIGYLRRNRIYKNGRVYDWEYIFSDYPLEELDVQNGQLEILEKLDVQKVHVENVHVQNHLQLNIKKENINKENIINNDDNNKKLNKNKIKALKTEIQNENQKYNCFEDERFNELLNKQKSINSLKDFQEFHKNLKINDLYRFKDISYFWLRIRESDGSSDLIINTEKKVLEVLKSFKKIKDQESILNFTAEEINSIFEICFKYYDPMDESYIYDINGYLSNVIRSKFNN